MHGKYTALGLYRDADDARIIVPKRIPALGWTINIGHRAGRVTLTAVLAAAAVAVVVSLWPD